MNPRKTARSATPEGSPAMTPFPAPNRPSSRRLSPLALFVLIAAAFSFGGWDARPARAGDEPPGGGGIEAKIKKKMQEILKLMQENERVLLRVSTGKAGDARRVDVDVPHPPSKKGRDGRAGSGSSGAGGTSGGSSAGGSSGGAAGKGGQAGGAGGPSGGEAVRKMRELIEGQKRNGGKIPGEMRHLLRMIPRRAGKGQGQPQDEKGSGDGKKEQEARDARKKLGEKKPGGKDPKEGGKSPKDPAKRMPNGKPNPDKVEQPKREDNVPAWMAALPPEIRDAMAGGRAEDIPPKYRHLIKAYHLWLQKHRNR